MAARKKKAPDLAAELADKMVRVLHAQRSLGTGSYPVCLQRLAEITDPLAPKTLVTKAANKKAFRQQVIAARAKSLDAPVALAEDLPVLAASPLLLEFLLHATRTATNHLFSPAELKQKATEKIRKAFQDALTRQLDEGTLPLGVGWVLNRSKKLFLLQDLHTGRAEPPPSAPHPVLTAPPPVPDGQPVRDFAQAFPAAFERLDRAQGGHNFVSLVELRQAVPVPRAVFDAGLQELRRAGRYTLAAAEGRHGISPAEREAGIPEEGALLLFVSRNG